MNRLYFDYNATAPLAPGLKEKMLQMMDEDYKNPNSAHQDGQKSKAVIESSRKTLSKLLNLSSDDKLIFTSGGTESNNAVIHSAYQNRGQKNAFVLTKVEHSCVENFAQFLKSQGVELRYVDVSQNGEIDLEQYKQLLDENVFLVSVMLAQNETGFVFPVKEMANLAHEKGVPVHTDVVCAMAKMPVDFNDLSVDYLTFSSHKFGGLKGVGGIAYKSDAPLTPYIYGGSQEMDKRAGTQNVFGIASSAFALEVETQDFANKITTYRSLRDKLKAGILEIYPQVKFIESKNNLPQTLSAAFVGLNGNLLLTNLDLEGVSVSYGSACASGSREISRIIRQLGLTIQESRSVLRISFGHGIEEQDIQEFLVRLQFVVGKMV